MPFKSIIYFNIWLWGRGGRGRWGREKEWKGKENNYMSFVLREHCTSCTWEKYYRSIVLHVHCITCALYEFKSISMVSLHRSSTKPDCCSSQKTGSFQCKAHRWKHRRTTCRSRNHKAFQWLKKETSNGDLQYRRWRRRGRNARFYSFTDRSTKPLAKCHDSVEIWTNYIILSWPISEDHSIQNYHVPAV